MSTPTTLRRLVLPLLLASTALVGGCDLLGIESASTIAARKDAEGRAVGAACRHAARSIEQCYALNRRAEKAAVFNGWREMNDYMRENNLEAMPAVPDPVTADAEAEADPPPARAGS